MINGLKHSLYFNTIDLSLFHSRLLKLLSECSVAFTLQLTNCAQIIRY